MAAGHVAEFKQRHRQFAARIGHRGIEFEHPLVDVLRLSELAALRPLRRLLEKPARFRLLLRGRFLELDGSHAIADLDVDFSGQVIELLADHVDDFGSRKPSAQIVRRKKFQIGKSNDKGGHVHSLHCSAKSFEGKLHLPVTCERATDSPSGKEAALAPLAGQIVSSSRASPSVRDAMPALFADTGGAHSSSATSRARVSKRVNSFRKVSGTSPTGTVTLLGDDQRGFALGLLLVLVGVRVILLAHEQADEVGILLDAAGFAEVAQPRAALGFAACAARDFG